MSKQRIIILLATVAPIAGLHAEAQQSILWHFTTQRPPEGWPQPGFDDGAWQEGAGGFGSLGTPGARVATEWRTRDIWLRRTFTLGPLPERPALYIHHDEDAQVFLNGQLVADLKGYTRRYQVIPLSDAAAKTLRRGRNTLAVHCHQTRGGQYIDVQIIDARHPPAASPPRRERKLRTRWADKVTPANAWPEYPRPQMVRRDWANLNGPWQYAITSVGAQPPSAWAGEVLVPFCIESQLSGVERQLSPDQWLWYRRKFTLPETWRDRRVWLHFEASDWETLAWVDGQPVGEHRGGYDPFSFHITPAIGDQAEHELLVRVWDPGAAGFHSIGKQGRNTFGYENSSGIWQTVWLEPTPQRHIADVKLTPSMDSVTCRVSAEGHELTVALEALEEGQPVAAVSGRPGEDLLLRLPSPHPWSPSDPHLYGLRVQLRDGERVVDEVTSYFGLRTIEHRLVDGVHRILLNDKPIFQFGPLDQNYWPESVLTPPCDDAVQWELNYLKRIGCNMIRLHIKENPRRWYYHCDRLGLLVWQDFICAVHRRKDPTDEESQGWLAEQARMMDALYNHPCIIQWTVFNESWSQHDTERIVRWVQNRDASRLVSAASGWTDVQNLGDIRDIHDYTTHPSIPVAGAERRRAIVLGESGGFNCVVVDHNWYDLGKPDTAPPPMRGRSGGMTPNRPVDGEWVREYKRPTYSPGPALREHFAAFVDDLRLLQTHGLCAAVYTQTTDMKHELNGWLTFDREVSKVDPGELRAVHLRLYQPPPKTMPLSPRTTKWRFSTTTPPAGWAAPNFDDSAWAEGVAPFGDTEQWTPGQQWATPRLYMRRRFQIDQTLHRAALEIALYGRFSGGFSDHVEVHLNGQLIHSDLTRHLKAEYRVAAINLRPEAVALLHPGANTLAAVVDVKGLRGQRLFDMALVAVAE